MNDEQIFQLAEKCGFQDDYGRWNFDNDGLLDFVYELRKEETEVTPQVTPQVTGDVDEREVWCDCGDGIMPNSGAKCGNCIAAESASREWVGLTDDDFYGQSESQVMAMKYAEAKLKEKNG